MRDYKAQYNALKQGNQGFLNAFDGSHGLYMPDASITYIPLWGIEQFNLARIDLTTEEAKQAQAKEGRALYFRLSNAEGYGKAPLLVYTNNPDLTLSPSFDFLLWTGILNDDKSLSDFPELYAMQVAGILYGIGQAETQRAQEEKDNTIVFVQRLRNIAKAITDQAARLDGEGEPATASLCVMERAFRLAFPHVEERFSDYAARLSETMETQWEDITTDSELDYFKARETATRQAIADLRGEVAEIMASDAVRDFWEHTFHAILFPLEEEKPATPAIYEDGNGGQYALKPHGKLAIAIEGGALGKIVKARSADALRRAREYVEEEQGIGERVKAIDAEIADLRAQVKAIEAEDLYNNRGDEVEALKAKIKALGDEKRKIRKDHREKSRGLIFDRGIIYETAAPVYINGSGNLERVYEDGEYLISYTIPPNAAVNLSAKSEFIPAGYATLLLHRIIEKCKQSEGRARIYFPLSEVYEMAGLLSNTPSQEEMKNARKYFSRAVNNLRLQSLSRFKKTESEASTPAKAFIYDGGQDPKTGRMFINLNPNLSKLIAADGSKIRESESVKNLPSAILKVTYWRLRVKEHYSPNKTLWTLEELCEALGYTINKNDTSRAKTFIAKTMDEFNLAGLLARYEPSGNGNAYTLQTIDQEGEGIYRAKYEAAARLQKRSGASLQACKQALEMNDWDEDKALSDLKAKNQARQAKRAAARKKKANKPTGDS